MLLGGLDQSGRVLSHTDRDVDAALSGGAHRDGLAADGDATDGPAAGVTERHAARPRRILMLCNLFTLPYRVMRCVAATGADVHVLGNDGAKGFRFSRYVASFSHIARPLDGSFDAELAEQVNAVIERLDIDLVLAGDQPSARSLIGLRPLLRAACFPMPTLETFDLLNDKWAFFQLCGRLGVRCPPTTLFADHNALWADIEAGGMTLPVVAKPLSLDGSRGVVVLRGDDAAAELDSVRYAPVLAQQFIEGADIGASAYCEGGRVRAFILHRLARATYTAFTNAQVRSSIEAIAAATTFTGVFNFDMRQAPDGTVYFLECNPRFFYKMNLSMLAGVNFVSHGLDPALAPNVVENARVRLPKALAVTLVTPWKLTSRDWHVLWHLYADPLSYLREALHIDWEDRSY